MKRLRLCPIIVRKTRLLKVIFEHLKKTALILMQGAVASLVFIPLLRRRNYVLLFYSSFHDLYYSGSAHLCEEKEGGFLDSSNKYYVLV